MVDLSEKEAQAVYRHIDSFLRHFEVYPQEESFWNKTYNIDVLKSVRNKLKEKSKNA